MEKILDDERYSIEERLKIAKEMLVIKNQEITALKQKYDKLQTDIRWYHDQTSIHRMGL